MALEEAFFQQCLEESFTHVQTASSASLHFSGHTFNISSCLNVAPNVNVNRISTEIKAYPNCISGGGSPQNFGTKRIHRLPVLAADLGHI